MGRTGAYLWVVLASFSILMSGCGKAAHDVKTGAHRDTSALTEPPQSQRVLIAPAARHHVVATVGRYPITLAYLEEWTPLEVLLASGYKNSATMPAGFIPDPPSYRKCIAYLRLSAGKIQLPAEQLKSRCEGQHEAQAQSTLGHLIRWALVHEEAASRGVHVSPSEVQQELASRHVSPSLVNALGAVPSQQAFAVGAEMLTWKMYETLPAYKKARTTGSAETAQMVDEVDNERSTFYDAMINRWISKTHCQPEYLVYGCSGYTTESSL